MYIKDIPIFGELSTVYVGKYFPADFNLQGNTAMTIFKQSKMIAEPSVDTPFSLERDRVALKITPNFQSLISELQKAQIVGEPESEIINGIQIYRLIKWRECDRCGTPYRMNGSHICTECRDRN